MANCIEICGMISAYVDNELQESEKRSFEEHLENCSECRREFDGIVRVLSLCREMPEEELPEGFSIQLHEKLLEIREQQTVWNKIIPFSGKSMKIASSIAAVLLVVFMARVFLFNYIDKGMAEQSGAAPRDAVAAKQAAPEMKAYDGMSAQDVKGIEENQTKGIQFNKNVNDELNARSTPPDKAGRSVNAQENTVPDGFGGGGGGEAQNAAPAETTSSSGVIGKTVVVTLNILNNDIDIAKLKQLATGFGAVFTEKQAALSIQADAPAASGTGEATLNFSIPGDNYFRLIDELAANYGSSSISTGTARTVYPEDVTKNIEALNTKLGNIDAEIVKLKSGNTADSDNSHKVQRLKEDRERTQKELLKLMNDSSSHMEVTVNIGQSADK